TWRSRTLPSTCRASPGCQSKILCITSWHISPPMGCLEDEDCAETEVDRKGDDMAKQTPSSEQGLGVAAPNLALRASHEAQHPGRLTGRRLGDYQLGELLGAGGMADVYRAYDRMLMRDVAVKVLSDLLSEDADYVDRFRAEARRVAALRHPHLVPVYHAGEDS